MEVDDFIVTSEASLVSLLPLSRFCSDVST